MGVLEITAGVLALVVITLGPGSGLYLLNRGDTKAHTQALSRIESQINTLTEGAQVDRIALLRALDQIERTKADVSTVQARQQKHADLITALSIQIALRDQDAPDGD